MNKKVLVIGGSGYIGTVLMPKLIKNNFQVINLDNFIYSQKIKENFINEKKNYQEFFFDVNSYQNLKKIPKVDFVIILSGLVGDPICKKYPSLARKTNIEGIKNIIEYFQNQNIKKLIFISTCSNYGYIESSELAKEDHPLNPISEYAKAKIEIENYLLYKNKKNNFSPCILRFATAYGLSPRMRFDLTINHFTYEILKKNKFDAFDINTYRPYCHTQDLTDSIIVTLNAKNVLTDHEVFNVGDNKLNYSKKQIIEEIEKNFGKGNIFYKENGSDARNYRVCFDKINQKLNFTTKFSIQDGIKECAEYIKKNDINLENSINDFGNFYIKNET
tara:strand:- start:753 stop:1748 length:996 start_codon:yes stop_codon:yes gene_type:complete